MMKKLILWGLLAIVLVLGVFLGRRHLASATAPSPVASSPSGERALPVYVHRVAPRDLTETVTATGSIAADESVDLVSELSGVVVELSIEEGRAVRAGEVLLRLDDSELQAQLEQTRQRVALAGVQAQRQQRLYDVRGTSRENLDTALYELRILEAELDLIGARLAKTTLRAPFDGVIGLRHVSQGAYVTPASRIATLQKIDRLKIDLAVPERYMQRLAPGATVTLTVAGRPEPFPGTIYAIEPRIDAATRTLRLRAAADNPDGRLLPGAFATVQVPLATLRDTLMIPAQALIPDIDGQTVWIVEDGRAASRRVETGLRLTREVQITRGLDPGDLVITSGQLQLRAGAAVRPLDHDNVATP